MKKILPVLAALLLLSPFANAKQKEYDFNLATDRYQWYQDVRQYISKKGGIACPAGTTLQITKEGLFSVQNFQLPQTIDGESPTQDDCRRSLRRLQFPLPAGFPGDVANFQVRPPGQQLTAEELDAQVFQIPAAE